MKKLKVYLDTSVISHLFADDAKVRMDDTILFWEMVKADKYEVFLSDTVTMELGRCKEPKLSKVFGKIKEIKCEILTATQEVRDLAQLYIDRGVLEEDSYDDCMHIAFAVIEKCDVIVSWNFRHLVNYDTIDGVKRVNAIKNYPEMRIMSPNMFLGERAL